MRVRVVDTRSAVGDVDAIVVEDDTFHVLGADPAWRPVAEHPRRVLDAAARSRPDALGSVVVVEETPLRLCAVVHDLDREPSCDPAAIEAALAQLLVIIERRVLVRIAMPLLGTAHGRLPLAEAAALLLGALARTVDSPLREVELRVEATAVDTVRALLATSLPQ